MDSRSLADTARLYLRHYTITETATSTDRNIIQMASLIRLAAVDEEASTWVIHSMLELRSVEQWNTGPAMVHMIQQVLARSIYRYNYRRKAVDTADNGLVLALANAQDRRHEFYVVMVAGILGTSYRPARTDSPPVGITSPTVEARMKENLDFTRFEAADFLRGQCVAQEIVTSTAVADAAVALVGSRHRHRASGDEVKNAVTAFALQQEAHHLIKIEGSTSGR